MAKLKEKKKEISTLFHIVYNILPGVQYNNVSLTPTWKVVAQSFFWSDDKKLQTEFLDIFELCVPGLPETGHNVSH